MSGRQDLVRRMWPYANQLTVLRHIRAEKGNIKVLIGTAVLLLYSVYFVWAVVLNYMRALPLIIFTTLACLYAFICIFGHYFQSCCSWWPWLVGPGIIVNFLATAAHQVSQRPRNLISLGGLLVFLCFLFLFSRNSSSVKWRPIFGGLGLQTALATYVRWQPGFETFRYLGERIQMFLGFADYGSRFVFGDIDCFAFTVLPVVIFFSCIISVLYHLGIMQKIVGGIAWIMKVTMGTSSGESVSAAANIFVGASEAPLLIRRYLPYMTKSELHAVMTGGFATIAGTVLSAYIRLGISPEHLICASVMNAPCAVAASKLFYPEEVERDEGEHAEQEEDEDDCEAENESNVLQAAASGASEAVTIAANVGANLVAFIALLYFANSLFGWLGSMVDYPELSFQLVCSYVFMPVAFLLGVDWQDAGIVGELIGMKLVLNEFVAYSELSTLVYGCHRSLSMRSEILATYALCGFANFSSIGIQLGCIGVMIPSSRRRDLADIAVRALITGTVTSFMTACVAGLLIVQDPVFVCNNNGTSLN